MLTKHTINATLCVSMRLNFYHKSKLILKSLFASKVILISNDFLRKKNLNKYQNQL